MGRESPSCARAGAADASVPTTAKTTTICLRSISFRASKRDATDAPGLARQSEQSRVMTRRDRDIPVAA